MITQRAWSPHVVDGRAKDAFANQLASRVLEEAETDRPIGGSVELVDNFVELADRLFYAGETVEGCEITDLYEISID